MEDYSPILVFADGEHIIEVTGTIVGPSGTSYDYYPERLAEGFYIAYLPPEHISGSEKYQDPRTLFEPIDVKKLARMPKLLREASQLLSEYPVLSDDRIPERLSAARTGLENKLAQIR